MMAPHVKVPHVKVQRIRTRDSLYLISQGTLSPESCSCPENAQDGLHVLRIDKKERNYIQHRKSVVRGVGRVVSALTTNLLCLFLIACGVSSLSLFVLTVGYVASMWYLISRIPLDETSSVFSVFNEIVVSCSPVLAYARTDHGLMECLHDEDTRAVLALTKKELTDHMVSRKVFKKTSVSA